MIEAAHLSIHVMNLSNAAAQSGEGGLLVQTRGKLLSIRFFFSIAMVRLAAMLPAPIPGYTSAESCTRQHFEI